MKEENKFKSLTNFEESKIINLWYLTKKFVIQFKKRRLLPKVQGIDNILILLCFYKINCDYDVLVEIVAVKPSTC